MFPDVVTDDASSSSGAYLGYLLGQTSNIRDDCVILKHALKNIRYFPNLAHAIIRVSNDGSRLLLSETIFMRLIRCISDCRNKSFIRWFYNEGFDSMQSKAVTVHNPSRAQVLLWLLREKKININLAATNDDKQTIFHIMFAWFQQIDHETFDQSRIIPLVTKQHERAIDFMVQLVDIGHTIYKINMQQQDAVGKTPIMYMCQLFAAGMLSIPAFDSLLRSPLMDIRTSLYTTDTFGQTAMHLLFRENSFNARQLWLAYQNYRAILWEHADIFQSDIRTCHRSVSDMLKKPYYQNCTRTEASIQACKEQKIKTICMQFDCWICEDTSLLISEYIVGTTNNVKPIRWGE